MKFRALLASLLLLVGTACQTVKPTPMLMGDMVDLNNEVVQLYSDCSEGRNYVSEKEGCIPKLLASKIDLLQELALEFVSADPKQPHGYDTYLHVTRLYFRICAEADKLELSIGQNDCS